jgi:hypothetical protein
VLFVHIVDGNKHKRVFIVHAKINQNLCVKEQTWRILTNPLRLSRFGFQADFSPFNVYVFAKANTIIVNSKMPSDENNGDHQQTSRRTAMKPGEWACGDRKCEAINPEKRQNCIDCGKGMANFVFL